MAVSDQFQRQLGHVWEAYVTVQEALAADDFSRAHKATAATEAALAVVDAGLLEADLRQVWTIESANLPEPLETMSNAKDLDGLRAGFAQLSEVMPVIITRFGLASADAVFQLHCRMVFDGRGASWLQKDDTARNPYFGATMLRCAEAALTQVDSMPNSDYVIP